MLFVSTSPSPHPACAPSPTAPPWHQPHTPAAPVFLGCVLGVLAQRFSRGWRRQWQGASPIPLVTSSSSCSIGLCPGDGGSSNSATREGETLSRGATAGWGQRGMLLPLSCRPSISPFPDETYIPRYTGVCNSLCICILTVSPIESMAGLPVSIGEIQ